MRVPVRSSVTIRPILVLAACAALVTGACRGGDGDSPELSLIASSAEAAAEAGTAKFEMTLAMSGSPVLEGTAMSGEGAFDNDRQAMRMAMRMAGPAFGPASSEELQIEMVMLDGVAYMNMGSVGQLAGFPTPWVSFDLRRVPGFSELLGSSGAFGSDPSQTLEFLRGADDGEVVGEEEVRGVRTTHHRATVTVGDILANAPDEIRDLLEGQVETLESVGLSEFPVDVWIDADGLPRRMRVEMRFEESLDDLPEGATMTIDMVLFDYGKPVTIEAPPPSQVTDMTRQFLGS